MRRAGPISSSRKSLGSRPAAAASSATKDWTAKAWGMFDTERNQPMRVWAVASGFSMRTLGIMKGMLMAVMGGLRRLDAAPRLALTVHDARGRGGRLHGHMGEMRDVVFGVEATRGARHRGVDVSLVTDHLARLPRRRLERRLEGRGIVLAVRAVGPLDLERLAALDGRPGVAPDDRDAPQRIELGGRRAPLDLHHADHSRHL